MNSGRVNIRYTERTGKYRLRFYGVAQDQKEVVQVALEIARDEIGTTFDSVALDFICMNYLESRTGKPNTNQVTHAKNTEKGST